MSKSQKEVKESNKEEKDTKKAKNTSTAKTIAKKAPTKEVKKNDKEGWRYYC